MKRRDFIVGLVAALAITAGTACKKDVRCKHCGMKVDPTSAWHAELVGEDGKVTAFITAPSPDFQMPEGVAADRDGNVYGGFTDVPAVRKYVKN